MPKSKPDPGQMFTFEHDGKTYSLPSGATKIDEIPGRLVRDAYMDGDAGEMVLGFTLLEKVDADPAAIAALYDKPAPEMLAIFRDWMRFRPSPEDATAGESSASSD
jgi:hypothetical protein